jgi:ABC-type nitrate/sulfonate/bicarbonate transport system ATPase subunit
MSAFLEIAQLSKVYPTPKGPAVIVKNFNLKMREGEFVSIIGHSGCGKSTVLMMVAGLNPVTEGGIVLAKREVTGAGPDRGVVFQSPSLLPWLTAFDNVMLGINQVFYTASATERRQIAEYYLSIVGLGDSMHKRPSSENTFSCAFSRIEQVLTRSRSASSGTAVRSKPCDSRRTAAIFSESYSFIWQP